MTSSTHYACINYETFPSTAVTLSQIRTMPCVLPDCLMQWEVGVAATARTGATLSTQIRARPQVIATCVAGTKTSY